MLWIVLIESKGGIRSGFPRVSSNIIFRISGGSSLICIVLKCVDEDGDGLTYDNLGRGLLYLYAERLTGLLCSEDDIIYIRSICTS